jgi:hypothetical protein
MHATLRPYITIGVAIAGASVLVATAVPVPGHKMITSQPAVAVKLQSLAADLPDGTGTSLREIYPPQATRWVSSDIARPSQTASAETRWDPGNLSPLLSGQVNGPNPSSSASLNFPSFNTDLARDAAVLGDAAIGTIALVTQFIAINVPINLANVIAAGIANPQDIPGLLSFMAHCLLLPEPYAEFRNEYTLLYRLTAPIIGALATVLPAPLGSGADPNTEPGWILTGWKIISDGIKQALAALPEPVIPAPTFGNVPPPIVPIAGSITKAGPLTPGPLTVTVNSKANLQASQTQGEVSGTDTNGKPTGLTSTVNSNTDLQASQTQGEVSGTDTNGKPTSTGTVNSDANLQASQTQGEVSGTDTNGKPTGSTGTPAATNNPPTRATNTDTTNTGTSSDNVKHPRADRRDQSRKVTNGSSDSGRMPARNTSRPNDSSPKQGTAVATDER